jgi:hypothetical protein
LKELDNTGMHEAEYRFVMPDWLTVMHIGSETVVVQSKDITALVISIDGDEKSTLIEKPWP